MSASHAQSPSSAALLVDGLKRFGFTGQEARVYLALLRGGPMSGYEAAQAAGISRSNAYAALRGLTDKGAARTAAGTPRHAPVPGPELVAALRRDAAAVLDTLERELPAPAAPEETFLAVGGRENVLARARILINGAERELLLAAPVDVVHELQAELIACLRRGARVVAVTDRGAGPELVLAGLEEYRREREPGSLLLVADGERTLSADLAADPARALACGPGALARQHREGLLDAVAVLG